LISNVTPQIGVLVMMKWFCSIPLAFCLLSNLALAQNGNTLFNETYVHEIRVTIDDPDFWNTLLANYNSPIGSDHVYIPTNIIVDGTQLDMVGFRIKGFSSVFLTSGDKKPFRIDFNEFVEGQHYDGIKKISLNNAALDPSYMRDVLAFNIMRHEGVEAPRTAYTKVYINNMYWGLYVMVEQIDKTFLKNHFTNDNGNLFKCQNNTDLTYLGSDPSLYKTSFELKTNEMDDDWNGFVDFVEYANKTGISNEDYINNFPQKFDIPTYLKILAIDVILLNWDSYYWHGRNFYLYEDTDENKFHWIPWDYSFAFSNLYMDILLKETGKPLIKNLLEVPSIRSAFIKTYKSILLNNFTTERLFPLIGNNKALIREHLVADTKKEYTIEVFDNSLEADKETLVRDTIHASFNVEQVFFVTDWSAIPDSILQSGLQLVDTTWFNIIKFDTVQVDNEEIVFMNCTQFIEYLDVVVGLRSFIQKRIDEVSDEIEAIGDVIVTDAEEDVEVRRAVLSPNPARQFIDINGTISQGDFKVHLVDMTGKIIMSIENQRHIEIDKLSPGMYVAEIISKSINRKVKFIKAAE
jgi:hypothetical protein